VWSLAFLTVVFDRATGAVDNEAWSKVFFSVKKERREKLVKKLVKLSKLQEISVKILESSAVLVLSSSGYQLF
jgi:glycine cleavage system regulatory protein